MAETMVERLAKVIGDHFEGFVHPDITPGTWASSMDAARSVLNAMREPTPEMIEAGMMKPFPGESPRLDDREMRDTWQAAIDVALASPQSPGNGRVRE